MNYSGEPHYPVPVVYNPRWHFYWTMPAYPTYRLIWAWHLWNHTRG